MGQWFNQRGRSTVGAWKAKEHRGGYQDYTDKEGQH